MQPNMVNPLACVKSQRSLYNRFNFIFAQLYGISYQLSFNYILFPRSEKKPESLLFVFNEFWILWWYRSAIYVESI